MKAALRIVGIGTSAGGLEALKRFFSNISPGCNMSYVVVPHLPSEGRTYLDFLLSRSTTLPVRLLTDNTVPQPDQVYVLPGNKKVTIKDGVLVVRDREPHEVINKAVNNFLLSLAEDQKGNAVAVILSGMGRDGAEGVKAVHSLGGVVIVQSPETTRFDGMPQAAIDANNPIVVSSPEELGTALQNLAHDL